MAVATWTPRAEWEMLRHEMNRWFERALPTMLGYEMEATEARWPRLDVRETETAYVVETDPKLATTSFTPARTLLGWISR